MGWSWRIATIRGIDIKVHFTFVLALVWGAFAWGQGTSSGLLYGAFLTLVLFGIVLLHELGHSLAAQRFGVRVHDIVLLPIGGVARLNRMPDKPVQELAVALAGPAVNLALALLAGPLLLVALLASTLRGGDFALPAIGVPGLLNFVAFVVVVNLTLLLFNMLPAFPMDGGRVLRSLLALRLPYGRATAIAAGVGRGFAVAFGLAGILTGNLSLGLIALFVFFGAGAERQEVASRESLRGLTVSEVVDQHAPMLPGALPAHLAFERLARSPYPVLAVVDEQGRMMGVVTRQGLQALWSAGLRGPVSDFAQQPALELDCGMSLDDARLRMVEVQAPVAPVYCGRRYAGLLDLDAIGRIVALRRMGLSGTGVS